MPKSYSDRYGLIGETLTHSYSPQIHALLGAYEYRLYPMPAEDVPEFFRRTELKGFNVTIPYKQLVMPLLSRISDTAARIGSVNTVWRGADGLWQGDNTDVWGFARLLGDTRPYRGAKALVLGSGGSSQTVQAVLHDAGITVVTVSRSGPVTYGDLTAHRDAQLIVNTTPVGMYPHVDDSPLDLTLFPKCTLVIDLIYNPRRTTLLLQAEDLGMQARDGLLMLTAQAQRASELWGLRPSGKDVSQAIADTLRRQMLNIALIGMPGCGKTAVGRELARLSGRPFVDIDEQVEARAGCPIPQLIAQKGEPHFRQLESAVLSDAAKASATIIATGGGVVTIPGNHEILRRNCRVFHLRRPLEELPIAGRPLSRDQGVAALWALRQPLYARFADAELNNVGVQATAAAIWQAMQ